MIIGILKEAEGENRVSALPEIVTQFIKLKVQVQVETGAGISAFASDADYQQAGATIVDRAGILQQADILLCINVPQENRFKNQAIVLGVFQPLFNHALIKDWASKQYTTFSMDTIPRTTRAQSMDVLSSQANIAGYKAVLLAATHYSRYIPMFMTAAGSIAPAKVLILGAGVAGLQAIATAKRLGAVVEVFDTRPAVKEEVMSLGAKFVEVEGAADASQAGGYAVEQSQEFLERQKQKIAESAAKADIIISTAQIPGRKAPILITKEMIHNMRAGSVIVDLAASTGGNTEVTVNNKTIVENHVSIIGNSFLPSMQASDASKVYGKNILNFLKLIIDTEGQINLNFEDDLVQGTCITHQGQIVNERVKQLIQ
ncbi:MAG: Re/Si-specific NAD(P)(+) transhydrogenase subunit alpha [Chitinophagaceae bacterium]